MAVRRSIDSSTIENLENLKILRDEIDAKIVRMEKNLKDLLEEEKRIEEFFEKNPRPKDWVAESHDEEFNHFKPRN